MQHQKLFMSLCILLAAAIAFAVGIQKIYPPVVASLPPESSMEYAVADGSDLMSAGSSFSAYGKSSLLTGIDPQVPAWDAMPLIKDIPWTRSDVVRMYNRAGRGRSCELFAPGLQTFQDLLSVSPGIAGPVGRAPVFSVALTMEPSVRESLPKLSKSKIISYLEEHLLILQARLYHDDKGSMFFGDRLGAAFCEAKSPNSAITPEPMIGQSVSQFRTLGLYVPANDEDGTEPDRRTLVLAFRYAADDSGLVSGVARSIDEYELIFVHLQKSDSGTASPVVFSTSNGRTQFHALETGNPDSLVRGPSVTATVRFDDFEYMGLYPSKPVVTGIRQRARLSLPTESVRARLLGLGDHEAVNLCQLLDQLHQEAETAAFPDAAATTESAPEN